MTQRLRFAGSTALLGSLILGFSIPSFAAEPAVPSPSTSVVTAQAPSAPQAPSDPQAAQAPSATSEPEPAPASSPSAADSLTSEQHIQLAQTLFRQNKYAEAGDHLLAAYAQSPNAVLLFNAGQAYRKALRPKEAQDAYQQMITTYPDHALVPEAKGYVQTLTALIAAVQAKEKIELSLQQQKKQSELDLAEERARREAVQKELSKYKKPYYKSAWFWLLISGAAITAGIVVAVPVGVNARSKTDGGTQHLNFALTF